MKAVAIIALLVLVAVVECRTKKQVPETSGFNFSSFKFPSFNLSTVKFPSFNISNPFNHWNPKGFKFVEEEVKPQTFTDKIKAHAKKFWAKRPWKKATPAPAPEASFFNFTMPSFNLSHFHLPSFNWSKPTHHWNPKGFKFVEEEAKPQTFTDKIKAHAKRFWAKRPWKKATPAPAPEASFFNFTRPSMPAFFNRSHFHLPTFNFTRPNLTWMANGFRFEEEVAAPKPTFVQRMKNHAKNLWNKRPWKKAAPAPETSSWNSAGYHFPTWNYTNQTNQTNHTWNNQGYRFVEESNVFDSIKNAVKGLWAKRPWKKTETKNTTEESAWTTTTTTYPNTTSWNSNGFHYPAPATPSYPTNTWNSQGYTFPAPTNTWNSAGYRFDEEETPAQPQTFTDKIKSHAKKIWAKRPWKKAN